jgi:hypothetical protein
MSERFEQQMKNAYSQFMSGSAPRGRLAHGIMSDSDNVVRPAVIADLLLPADRPGEIDEVVQKLRAGLRASEVAQKALINEAQVQLQAADNSAFVATMERARDQAKADMQAQIDAAYAELTEIGQRYPGSQPAIAAAFAEVTSLATSSVNAVNDALNTVGDFGHVVLDGLKGAGNAVVDVAEKTGEVFKEAGKKVGEALEEVGNKISIIFSGW